MLTYVRGETIVATHSDQQNIDPKLYGDDVFIVPVPDGTVFERDGDPPPDGEPDLRLQKIPAPDKPLLKSYAANKRWRLENNGSTSIDGVEYHTDTTSRSKLNTAYLATQIDKALRCDWKLKDGTFTELTSDQIRTAVRAVHDFVEDAFSLEKAAVAAIDAGSADSYEDIDAIFLDLATFDAPASS